MQKDKFQNKYIVPTARASFHNYNEGIYFITICTKDAIHYFGEISDAAMRLNRIGEYTNECIKKIEALHQFVRVPQYVIMPNHIHILINYK